jgi:uncharacterized membrane protein YiaA
MIVGWVETRSNKKYYRAVFIVILVCIQILQYNGVNQNEIDETSIIFTKTCRLVIIGLCHPCAVCLFVLINFIL